MAIRLSTAAGVDLPFLWGIEVMVRATIRETDERGLGVVGKVEAYLRSTQIAWLRVKMTEVVRGF